MKVLTIGGATQDIFILHEQEETITYRKSKTETQTFLLLQEGKKIEINIVIYTTGGGATNAAVSFKRLGFDVTTFFKVGNDSQATAIVKQNLSEILWKQNFLHA